MREERGFAPRNFAPVKVGEELDVEIESEGEKGDGVAKVKGFVLFVPNAKKGDQVRVRITKVFRKMGFGEVIGEAKGEASSGGDQPSVASSEEEDQPVDSENFGEEEPEQEEEQS